MFTGTSYNHLARTFAYRHRPVATCCSGIVRFVCLRDHLSGLVSPVGRTVKREGNVPTQYDHREGSEGLERHIRRSARFFFPRRLLILRRGAAYQQSGPTTSDMAERFTGPSRECMEWLPLAGRDGTVSGRSILGLHRLHIQSPRKWSTSADFRELAWTAVCESATRRYIHGQTDGRFIGHVNFQRF